MIYPAAELLELARRYYKALEENRPAEEVMAFYDPGVTQIEYPNRLTIAGATRNLEDLMTAAERGKKAIVKQTFEIRRLYAQDQTVVAELIWTGVLAVPFGTLKAGDSMKAYFANFIEFKDGKIFRQRNYDCFEPF